MMPKKKPLIYPYDETNFFPPAPAVNVSLSTPINGQIIKSLALLDSGADITAIPEWIVQRLQLKYVDETSVEGYEGVPTKKLVYSVKIIFDNLGDFIIKVIPIDDKYVLVGRDILNSWSVLLKGRSKTLKIS
ncbi:MAG: retroviral-like aspartic protease family protein [Candidatus Omnitrophica bacterium]|nr:retroviral-like aspartic protease family protein [Candidatus Omnitrophota bacterium]